MKGGTAFFNSTFILQPSTLSFATRPGLGSHVTQLGGQVSPHQALEEFAVVGNQAMNQFVYDDDFTKSAGLC
jgi:hypothetical protein